MTLQTAVTIFNILQDKYGSPNVVTSEVIHYFNLAVNEYLNRLFPDTQGGLANVESDANTLAQIQPLVYVITGLAIPVGGVIASSTINAQLVITAGSGATYFRILAAEIVDDSGEPFPIRFAKHNNIARYRKNDFKSPVPKDPTYLLRQDGIAIEGPPVATAVRLTVVKTPKSYSPTDLNADVEFPDYTTYTLITIALKMAGVATRDEELIQDTRLTGVQLAQ
jgi:hypothetical protein